VCGSRTKPSKLAKGVFGEVIDEAILLEARGHAGPPHQLTARVLRLQDAMRRLARNSSS
jgi:hypothetical protein